MAMKYKTLLAACAGYRCTRRVWGRRAMRNAVGQTVHNAGSRDEHWEAKTPESRMRSGNINGSGVPVEQHDA
jgi:hypothetical protein